MGRPKITDKTSKVTTFAQMVTRVAEKCGIEEFQFQDAVAALVADIKSEIAQGRSIVLPKLGKFGVVVSKRKQIWNPVTKEMVETGVRYVPKFVFIGTTRAELQRSASEFLKGKADRDSREKLLGRR